MPEATRILAELPADQMAPNDFWKKHWLDAPP
jgi:hypothetical protein